MLFDQIDVELKSRWIPLAGERQYVVAQATDRERGQWRP
jgi:hypothetical protein